MSSPSPEEIFDSWHGIIDEDFCKTIRETFKLPEDDTYIYRAGAFAKTLPQIEEAVTKGKQKYIYQEHGKAIEVCSPISNTHLNVD
jgi:hypothetical protein